MFNSCETELVEDEGEKLNLEEEKRKGLVKFEEQSFGENICKEDMEAADRRMTRSLTDVQRRELEWDEIFTFWIEIENAECFNGNLYCGSPGKGA